MKTFIKVCVLCGIAIWVCGYTLLRLIEVCGYSI